MTNSRTGDLSALGPDVFRLVEQLTDLLRDGKHAEFDEVLAANPEHADALNSVLPSICLLNDFDASRTGSIGTFTKIPEDDPHLGLRGRLGDFQILREIGRGGMGVVYEAEQLAIARRVALKVLPFAAMLDKSQIARFQIEARAAATLEHPHIVPVYFVGKERGVYFYAMRLIDGKNLNEIVSEIRQSKEGLPSSATGTAQKSRHDHSIYENGSAIETIDEIGGIASTNIASDYSSQTVRYYKSVARIALQVAKALEFAHAHGIIHRDIKPANIILDDDGDAWVTDFGLARMETDNGVTMTGRLVGTLRYMSPEQASATGSAIDHRSDIYSLGATVYELLTLSPVFADTDRAALIRNIASQEPKPPSRRVTGIPHDLETIVLKTLQKAPGDRYGSAGELAADLQRFLSRRPVAARRTSIARRCTLWAQRHPTLVAAATIVMAVILTAAAAIGLLVANHERLARKRQEAATAKIESALREREEAHRLAEFNLKRANNQKLRADAAASEANQLRTIAESQTEELRQQIYAKDMRQAFDAWNNGWTDDVDEILKKQSPEDGQRDYRGFEWKLLRHLARQTRPVKLQGHDGPVYDVALFENGTRLASVGEDATIRSWDLETNREEFTLHDDRSDKRLPRLLDALYAVTRGEDHGVFRKSKDLRSLAVSPSGDLLVTGNRVLSLWDLNSRSLIRDLTVFPTRIFGVAFSSRDDFIAAHASGEGVRLFNSEGTLVQSELTGHGAYRLSFSPDGSKLAVPYKDQVDGEIVTGVRLWQLNDWASPLDYPTYASVRGVAFSSDGGFLLCGGFYGDAFVLNLETGKVTIRTPQLRSRPTDVALSASDAKMAIAYQDGTVAVAALPKLWHGIKEQVTLVPRLIPLHDGPANSVRFVDEDRIATAGNDGLISISHVGETEAKRSFTREGLYKGCVYLPTGNELIVATRNGICRFDRKTWDVNEQFDIWNAGNNIGNAADITSLTVSADGTTAAFGNRSGSIAICDLTENRIVQRFDQTDIRVSEIDDIALSPDQRWIANGSRDHTIRARSTEGWHEVYRIRTKGWGTNVEFSPDGRFLAYADSEGELAIVETGTWREVVRRKAKSNFSPDALRFSPDGHSIVSGHSDSIIRIWDVQTLSLMGELKGHMRTVLRLAIHPDGKTLATVSADASVRLWNLPTRTLLGTLDTFEQTPWDCRFSATGNQLAVMTRLDDDATCHVWRVLEAE